MKKLIDRDGRELPPRNPDQIKPWEIRLFRRLRPADATGVSNELVAEDIAFMESVVNRPGIVADNARLLVAGMMSKTN